MIHTCHAKGCNKAVAPKYLMCGRHWSMVPKPQQAEIWRHYRPGQEEDKRPSAAYVTVMKAAIDAVDLAEGGQRSLI